MLKELICPECGQIYDEESWGHDYDAIKEYNKCCDCIGYCPYCEKSKMKCTACGNECYDNIYPEIIFKNNNICICEECSIDYEEVDDEIRLRNNV